MCMLHKWEMSKFFIVVYVDDPILVCNNNDKLVQVKDEISQKFEMKDLGNLHLLLGMELQKECEHLFYIHY